MNLFSKLNHIIVILKVLFIYVKYYHISYYTQIYQRMKLAIIFKIIFFSKNII